MKKFIKKIKNWLLISTGIEVVLLNYLGEDTADGKIFQVFCTNLEDNGLFAIPEKDLRRSKFFKFENKELSETSLFISRVKRQDLDLKNLYKNELDYITDLVFFNFYFNNANLEVLEKIDMSKYVNISFVKCKITDEKFVQVFKNKQLPNLNILDLTGNHLTENVLTSLISINCKKIKEIIFETNNIKETVHFEKMLKKSYPDCKFIFFARSSYFDK